MPESNMPDDAVSTPTPEQKVTTVPPTSAVAKPNISLQITLDVASHALAHAQHEATHTQYFYFAYGSNLSYSQMRQRCTNKPDISAKPLAIARLNKWRWIICERGYANVLPPTSVATTGRATYEYE